MCGLETVVLRGESMAAANSKINVNFKMKGFVGLMNSCGFYEQGGLMEVRASKSFILKLHLSQMRWL